MNQEKHNFWLSPKGFAACGLILAVSYFLFMEHRQHLAEWFPFLIILLCPLMHIFMHSGHGGHEHEGHENSDLDDAYRRGYEEGQQHREDNDDFPRHRH